MIAKNQLICCRVVILPRHHQPHHPRINNEAANAGVTQEAIISGSRSLRSLIRLKLNENGQTKTPDCQQSVGPQHCSPAPLSWQPTLGRADSSTFLILSRASCHQNIHLITVTLRITVSIAVVTDVHTVYPFANTVTKVPVRSKSVWTTVTIVPVVSLYGRLSPKYP